MLIPQHKDAVNIKLLQQILTFSSSVPVLFVVNVVFSSL